MKKTSLLFILLFSVLMSGFATDYKIAWASENVTADVNYISDLEAAGYTVDAVNDKWKGLTSEGATTLNTYDLVIISKKTNSADYGGDETVRSNWQNVTTPVLNLQDYVNRNSRLEFLNTADNNGDTDYFMTAVATTHALFTNATLTGNDSTLMLTDEKYQVSGSTDAGNGTLIAKDPSNGFVSIAFWEAGKACYDGAGVQAGNRMFYAFSNSYNLTEAGKALWLDAVEYMTTGSVTDRTNPSAIAPNKEASFSIYPNPTTSTLNISGVENVQATIYTLTGKQIATYDNISSSIDVSSFAQGMYMISIATAGKQEVYNFIKK